MLQNACSRCRITSNQLRSTSHVWTCDCLSIYVYGLFVFMSIINSYFNAQWMSYLFAYQRTWLQHQNHNSHRKHHVLLHYHHHVILHSHNSHHHHHHHHHHVRSSMVWEILTTFVQTSFRNMLVHPLLPDGTSVFACQSLRDACWQLIEFGRVMAFCQQSQSMWPLRFTV